MKIAILLGAFLFVILGAPAESRASSWENKLQANLDRMNQRLEADAQRREFEFERWSENFQKKMEQQKKKAEAREKELEAKIEDLRQKCAKKGYSDDLTGFQRTITVVNSKNGIQSIYVQYYNSTTKQYTGSYYGVNENDPKAEPICGKLDQNLKIIKQSS